MRAASAGVIRWRKSFRGDVGAAINRPEMIWEPVFFDNANRIYGLGL